MLFYSYRLMRVFWGIKLSLLSNFLHPIYLCTGNMPAMVKHIVIKHVQLCVSVTLIVLLVAFGCCVVKLVMFYN